MVSVYQIFPSVEAAVAIPIPDPDEFCRTVLRDLKSLEEDAKIPDFQLADPDYPVSGFFQFSTKVLMFNRDVYLGDLGRALGYSGNVHTTKLTDTGEELFFLNVTAFYNCLDFSNTVYYTPNGEERGVDHGMGIKEFAFHHKLIGDSWIFRIPQMKSAIFVASDGSGGEDDFYTLYHKLKMKGLKFKKIWSEVA